MKTKLMKIAALLAALLTLVMCLPVAGLAAEETETRDWFKPAAVGAQEIVNIESMARDVLYPILETTDFEDLNQKVTFKMEKVGKGITIIEKNLGYTKVGDGVTYSFPYFIYTVEPEADGELIVFSIYDKTTDKTYRYKISLSVQVVAKPPIVSAAAASELVMNKYGHYELTAEEGSAITITPVYETIDGKKWDKNMGWFVYERGGYSPLLSEADTYTYVVTNELNGCDLVWSAHIPDASYGGSNWITLTVVPKGTLVQPAAPSVPNTGDSAAPMLWLAGMLLAGAGCAVLMGKRRQNG